MHKTCTGIKKKKKNSEHLLRVGGSIDHKSFVFFDACAGFVKIMLCFFLFFLMPVHVWWRLESQNLHRHQKNKKNKPLDAQNLHRHQKNQKKQNSEHLLRVGGSIDHKSFVFFDACAGFVKIMLCFFCFFWCLCRFCEDHAFFCLFFSMPAHVLSKSAKMKKMKKHAFHQHFRPFRCIKHCKLQCFALVFFQKPPPHGG